MSQRAVALQESAPTSESPCVVLIVEDEVLVSAAAASYLRACKFVILEAVDVDQALALLQVEKSIGVVFTDVRLPGPRSGLDLARTIRREYPSVKVLLTTGAIPTDVPGVATQEGLPLLRKPYFLFDLERMLVKLLNPGPFG